MIANTFNLMLVLLDMLLFEHLPFCIVICPTKMTYLSEVRVKEPSTSSTEPTSVYVHTDKLSVVQQSCIYHNISPYHSLHYASLYKSIWAGEPHPPFR